jgi:hypothetical protein
LWEGRLERFAAELDRRSRNKKEKAK